MKICRIVAPPATVADRLRGRESGVKREFLLRIAPRLDEHLSTLGVDDLTVDNGEDKSVTGVALEILRKLGWPAPSAPTIDVLS